MSRTSDRILRWGLPALLVVWSIDPRRDLVFYETIWFWVGIALASAQGFTADW